MPRMTAEERATLAQLADRQKAEDEADSGLEVWARNDKGHEVKLTGTRARKFLASFGLDDEEGQGDGQAAEEEEEADDPPGGAGYFKSRGK